MKKWIPLVTLLIVLLFGGKVSAKENKYEVHFIDLGQSDCILIKGEEKSYLIDTGLPYTSDVVLKYLDSVGVNKIEDIIITHYHDDHYGGLKDIVREKSVNRVILPRHQPKYREVLFPYLNGKGIRVEYINDSFRVLGDGIDLRPLLSVNEDLEIENNNATALVGTIDGIKYAFMADVEKEREKYILRNKDVLDCQLVKVPHHGLDTSSTEELVKAINPRIAIITCDGAESPNPLIVERYSQLGTAIFRTDMHGNIVVKGYPKDKAVEIITNKVIK